MERIGQRVVRHVGIGIGVGSIDRRALWDGIAARLNQPRCRGGGGSDPLLLPLPLLWPPARLPLLLRVP